MNWNELITALTPVLWGIVEALRFRRRRSYKRARSLQPSSVPPYPDYDETTWPPPARVPSSDGLPGRAVERDSYPSTPSENRAQRRARERRGRRGR